MAFEYYSYFEVEDPEGSFFQFVTDNSVVYTVYFKIDEYAEHVKDFPLLLHKGFSFGFVRQKSNSNRRNFSDPKVFETIYKIVNDFVTENGSDTVLLYHCDTSDDKQECRNRLFNSWSNYVQERQGFYKHSIEAIVNLPNGSSQDMYLGFITQKINPEIDGLLDGFSEYLITPK